MNDRNVQYPNRFRMVKVPGTDDIVDLIPAPGTITEEGTLVNKSALLKDATAALFGFTAEQIPETVPDDVLAILSKAALLSTDGKLTNIAGELKGIRIEIGSYVGTGAASGGFIFGFRPKFVMIISGFGGSINGGIAFFPVTALLETFQSYAYQGITGNQAMQSSRLFARFDNAAQKLEWYTDFASYGAAGQMNDPGRTYYVISIV